MTGTETAVRLPYAVIVPSLSMKTVLRTVRPIHVLELLLGLGTALLGQSLSILQDSEL